MDLSLDNLLAGALVASLVALVAWLGDRRRRHRIDPDAVGFMDWTSLFFFALFADCLLLGGAARLWFAA